MFKRVLLSALCAVCFMLSVLPAVAHEFIIVPQQWERYEPGQVLPFSAVSSHVFMKSEELENPANVKVEYMGKSVPVAADEAFASYTGRVTLGKPGAALLHGHRLGEVWSKTTKGILKGDRSTLSGVVWARKYEKFCKTLLPVGGKTDGWDAKTGDELEIVPLSNPLDLRPGDSFDVQVLHKGKPVSPEVVTATYDGFTDTANAYAYVTEPYGEGKATIKVSAPGFWMVRVQVVVEQDGGNYEQHAMRAVLAFPVR